MRTTRLSLTAALALGALLATASPSLAQNTNSTQRAGRRPPTVQQRVDRMATELSLSEDQKTKVTALFEEQAKARQEVIANKALSQEDRREKARAMREAQTSKLKAILTPEQYTKWEKSMQDMRGRRRSQNPTPPPSTDTKSQ